MSIALWIGGTAAVLAGVIIGWTARAMRTRRSSLPPALVERRARLREALHGLLAALETPSVTGSELPEHAASADVEARLLSGDRAGAVAAAERAVAEDPRDAGAALLLARALVGSGELDAAAQVVDRADSLGAQGPMFDYLVSRVACGLIERAQGETPADGALPPLVTPFEMLVLQLERQRRLSDRAAAVWLATATGDNETLGHEQIRELVVHHFESYYGALGGFIDAARGAPAFADALYHAARMALKVGFIDDGRALLEAIEPLMVTSSERQYYHRDLAALRDEPDLLTARPLPAVAPTAVRARSLKVLQ